MVPITLPRVYCVLRDVKKAIHYWELAAIGGHLDAKQYVGISEIRIGNMKQALKHFLIAAELGHTRSLEYIKEMFKSGVATKDGYAKALRVYQSYLNEIKSPQRDEAAASYDDCKYYYLLFDVAEAETKVLWIESKRCL